MQLVTRLLLRLIAVGMLMLVVALLLSVYAAKQDIGSEAAGSQKVGQLIQILAKLQANAALAEQTAAINALNDSGTLRHFHVALLDQTGRRLTQQAQQSGALPLSWLNRILTNDVALPTYSVSVTRPGGELVTVVLEPNPYSESTEAMTSALLLLGLFFALTLSLIAAMWISVKLAFAPLTPILSGIARIEAGDYSVRLPPSDTRELNQIGQALNHLAGVLTEQIAKQRELLHRLQDVQEDERRKLAHELHDEFGQLLTAIQVDASYLLKQSNGQPALEACAQAMYDNSSSILSQLKSLLAQLRPYGLQGDEEHDIALEQALRDLVRQRQSRGDVGLACSLSVNLATAAVPQRLAVAVYRIAQEALTNVMRHAQATRVDMVVSVEEGGRSLRLTVADDGRGLDLLAEQAGVPGQSGLGLAGMRERILANQGSLQLRRAVPHGLIVEARFPLLTEEQRHDN